MQLKTPVIIINLKKYDEVLGKKSLKFSRMAKKLSLKHNVTIVVAPPFTSLDDSAKITLTMSQHMDPCEPGACTGTLIPKEMKELGVIGSLINHSERRIPFDEIKKCVDICKKYDLVSVVCARDIQESRELAKFAPDFIAIEPPELIGGDISVSTARPEVIRDTVNAVREVSPNTLVLCGAGVKKKDDVRKAIELGAKGILVASGVAKAKNVRKAMEDLVLGAVQ